MIITHAYMLKKPNYTQRISKIDGWTLNNCLKNCLNDTDDETQNTKFNGIVFLTITVFLVIIYLSLLTSITMMEETDILYNKLGIIFSFLIILRQLLSSFMTIIYLNKEIYLTKLQQKEFETLSFSTIIEGNIIKTRQIYIKITIEYFTALYVISIVFTFLNICSISLFLNQKYITSVIFELISSVALISIMIYIFVTGKKKTNNIIDNLQDIVEILNLSLNQFFIFMLFTGLLYFHTSIIAIINLEQH